MKCPVDETVLMMSERSGVEIDYCPTCRGVWLDRGELDKILDRAAREQGAAGDPAVADPSPGQTAPPVAPGGLAGAPGAGTPRYGGAFEEGPVPPPAPDPGYPPHQPYARRGFFGSAPSAPSPEDYYRGGYGRRRRSWLEDLFD